MNYDINDVFLKWSYNEKKDGTQRFMSSNRTEALLELVQLCLDFNIEYSDAKSLTPRVVKLLTTYEGRKNKGKHVGWCQKVESDFLGMLANSYLATSANEFTSKQAVKNPKESLMKQDLLIEEWCINKFQDLCSDGLIQLAHIPLNALNIQMLEDIYESNWNHDEKLFPLYVKKGLNLTCGCGRM